MMWLVKPNKIDYYLLKLILYLIQIGCWLYVDSIVDWKKQSIDMQNEPVALIYIFPWKTNWHYLNFFVHLKAVTTDTNYH